MGHKTTLGGDRLGSGKKNKVWIHGFERTTVNMDYVWRSTMTTGTLVPFLKEVALPGDTFDIDLNADVKTIPTLAPLFGSFKLQLDVFTVPMRLYIRKLHNNITGIGTKMNTISIPQAKMRGSSSGFGVNKQILETPEINQINPSSLLYYLGISSLGSRAIGSGKTIITRQFNAIPLLGYWDIFKNYYANKQENSFPVINPKAMSGAPYVMYYPYFASGDSNYDTLINGQTYTPAEIDPISTDTYMFAFVGVGTEKETIQIQLQDGQQGNKMKLNMSELFLNHHKSTYSTAGGVKYDVWVFSGLDGSKIPNTIMYPYIVNLPDIIVNKMSLTWHYLDEIDEIREYCLSNDNVILSGQGSEPGYSTLSRDTFGIFGLSGETKCAAYFPMSGLICKTYQSDLFTNFLDTETISNQSTGINAITSVSTEGNKFTMDALILAKKTYQMLNNIAVQGNTYDDWLEAVYDHKQFGKPEIPVYEGGLSKEIVFQEVVSSASSENEPLGTLAGRGHLSPKHKGGKIVIKIQEPSYIMGIVSITPRVDYSQGNDWDVNLKTIDDLHKPDLDQIGFEDMIGDTFASLTTKKATVTLEDPTVTYESFGKQPAWINYMTKVNKVCGDFADPNKQMHMVLKRQFGFGTDGNIDNFTTYINPEEWNYMFAYNDMEAQNFWTQIAVDMKVRRKMSAKVMPVL